MEDLTIAFDAALNVLTGETGAGKSILVGAIGLALGQRADALLVRKGEEEACVEATFSLPALHNAFTLAREAGVSCHPEEDLIIRRVVLASGKSKAFLNDQAVSLTLLERVAGSMLDLVGQHSHQSLLKEEFHRDLLDAFGHHGNLLEELRGVFQNVCSLEAELARLHNQEKEKQEKLEFYRFQSREIGAARLREGEDDELDREMDLLSHAQKWQELAASVLEELTESEDSLTRRVGLVQSKLSTARQADASLNDAVTNIQEALVLLKDSAEAVRCFGEKASANPQRLLLVQERLSLIESLKRKHGKSVDEILVWARDLEEKIVALENISVTMEDIAEGLKREKKKLEQIAVRFTQARKSAAEKLSSKIRAQLQALGMERVGLTIALEPIPVADCGAEEVRILVAPNEGEGFKPLAAIASGGEISRVLLAIKIVFSASDSIPTLVFDEVDANIGGTVAAMVGQKLRDLASSHQIIAITHLPQIAHRATAHFQVSKQVVRGRTLTQIKKIQGDEKNQEITRMMGGENFARELLRGKTA